ncbi:ABC transporter substrate-binding protein [Blastococcus haudaquaticus]|uniref:NitT/TauT family transport system substrate-binding protein n=1 Tax=Blastococcus haudaquaticus TaxID=1938745 RepID=A0A286GC61_9ACTN|nr:ABC transporter substrate-binding protein [Blastococcus haudaquaticus]SOD93091.1 NitT/TauT family transport system substrate-binding protein [Blastococcus haudaquaticus]
MRRLLTPVAALALLIPLAACGGDDSSGDGGGGGGDAQEVRELRVGVIPIVDVAPIYLGVEQGFFEDRGMDVELVPGSGGAAAVPGVVSGDYDFSFGNVTSVLLAGSEGLPLRIVANGVATTGDPETDFSGVVVPGDSAIQDASGLQGRTVAVNNLKNIGEVTIRKAIEDAGGDPSDVNFVELPFPEMPAAVAGGDVDAAWVVEPFLTVSKNQGSRSILAPFAEPIENLTVACYFTTEQMLQEDPELVDEFQAAMEESLTYANENPDEVRRIILTYTQVPPEAAEAIALPSFPAEIDVESVETVAELMQEFGITSEQADVDSLLATD